MISIEIPRQKSYTIHNLRNCNGARCVVLPYVLLRFFRKNVFLFVMYQHTDLQEGLCYEKLYLK